MGLITVSGEPGCRVEEITRLTAHRLGYECITEARLRTMIAGEFGSETAIQSKAHSIVVASVLAHLGSNHHLVVPIPRAERLFTTYPGILRAFVQSTESRIIGTPIVDHQWTAPSAQ